jgi:hypothetical protein
LRDERSVAGAAAIAAHRDEDLLVQLSVLSGAAPPALAIPASGAAGGVARHLTRFFPHHERRFWLPALLGHVCASRITATRPVGWSRRPETALASGADPMASPFGTTHPRCELVIPS